MSAAEERDDGLDKERGAPAGDGKAAAEPGVAAVGNAAIGAPVDRPWVALLSKNAWIAVPLLVPVAGIVGAIQGPGAAILVLVAAALILVISLFWASVRTLLGETPLSGADAYALAAPRAEEEQKQAILRALKDLEFERSVGKISDEDYAALVVKYRAEAKRLLRVLDEDAKPRRESVESLVHARLVQAGLAEAPAAGFRPAAAPVRGKPAGSATPPSPFRITSPSAPGPELKKSKKKKSKPAGAAAEASPPGTVEILSIDEPEKGAAATDVTQKSLGTVKTQESAAYVPKSKTCAECATKNDPDAVFCKKCGAKSFAAGDETVEDGGGDGKSEDGEPQDDEGAPQDESDVERAEARQ